VAADAPIRKHDSEDIYGRVRVTVPEASAVQPIILFGERMHSIGEPPETKQKLINSLLNIQRIPSNFNIFLHANPF
jgi:hypothetical protein